MFRKLYIILVSMTSITIHTHILMYNDTLMCNYAHIYARKHTLTHS